METTLVEPATSEMVLLRAIDEVASVDRAGWAGAARTAELERLLEARERLDAAITALVGSGTPWGRGPKTAPAHQRRG
jgi:hypothetical protein